MFQKNIVLNMETNRKHNKYENGFDFALKTRNSENKKSDFKKFEDNKTFNEIIRLALDYYQRQNRKVEESREEGIEQGIEQEKNKMINKMIKKGFSFLLNFQLFLCII